MRSLFFLSVLLLFSTCKNTKKTTEENQKDSVHSQIARTCPEDGSCDIQMFRQSTLLIRTDNTGKIYPVIEKGDQLVVKYEYKRKPIENTADSNYSEIIYFELPDKKLNLNLQDEDLRQVKLLFGRICFCRGASGYFPVTEGNLITEETVKDQLKISLNFSIKKIPQIIEQIDETIDLK